MYIAESNQLLHNYKILIGMASVSVCLTTMTSCSTHPSYVKLRPLKHRKQVLESLDVLHYIIRNTVRIHRSVIFYLKSIKFAVEVPTYNGRLHSKLK